MSTFVEVSCVCPRCSKQQTARVAQSLNVSRSPAHRDLLLRGDLHRHTCRCGHASTIDVDFNYLDFDRKQLFSVFSETKEERWQTLERIPADALRRNFSDDALPLLVRDMAEGFCVRAVFGLSALLEKVLVFDAALDDVALEVTKLVWMRSRGIAGLSLARRPRVVQRHGADLVLKMANRTPAEAVLIDIAALRTIPLGRNEIAAELRAGPYVDVGRLL
jgi:hypothetical protein